MKNVFVETYVKLDDCAEHIKEGVYRLEDERDS